MLSAFAVLVALLAQAPGTKLPKGAVAPDAAVGAKPVADDSKGKRTCFLDLAEPPGGTIQFTDAGKIAWLLINAEPGKEAGGEDAKDGDKKKKKTKVKGKGKAKAEDAGAAVRRARTKYVLYKLTLKTRKADAVLSIEHRPGASLMIHGEPPVAVSLVAFGGKTAACYEGPAAIITVPLGSKEEQPAQTTGQFQLAPGPAGMNLVDLKKAAVVSLDTVSFQTKPLRKVAAVLRPLWFEPGTRKMVAWHDDGKQRGLVRYEDDGEVNVKRLAFIKGDRVLQRGGEFAVAHLDAASNALELRELDTWTGVAKPGVYKLQLPPAYPAAQASVHAHFGKRLAFVQGANFLAKSRWQRLFVYDYTNPEPILAVPVTGQEYIHNAVIEPAGEYGIVELRNQVTRMTESVKLFNFAKKSFEDVTLKAPK